MLKKRIDALFKSVEQRWRDLRARELSRGHFPSVSRETVTIFCHRRSGVIFYAGSVDLLPGESFTIRQDYLPEPTNFSHWTLLGPPDADVTQRQEGYRRSMWILPGTRSGKFIQDCGRPGTETDFIIGPQVWVVRRRKGDEHVSEEESHDAGIHYGIETIVRPIISKDDLE